MKHVYCQKILLIICLCFILFGLLTFSVFNDTACASEEGQFCCDDIAEGEQGFIVGQEGDGSPENPFKVSNARQLNHIRKHLNAHFIQVNDIVFTEDLNGGNFEGQNLNGNMYPIGEYVLNGTEVDATKAFTGSYDGQGYKIIGLEIDTTAECAGLFGYVRNMDISSTRGAKITGVTLLDGSVKSTGDYAGGIAGRTDDGLILKCSNGNSIISLAGASRPGDFDYVNVGGIVGYATGTAVEISYNTGKVENTCTDNGRTINVGGIIGYNASNYVKYCFNTGEVSAMGENTDGSIVAVGGIIGRSIGIFQASYNIGHAGGGKYNGNVVGFIPGALSPIIASNCHYLSTLTGTIGGSPAEGFTQSFATSEENFRKLPGVPGSLCDLLNEVNDQVWFIDQLPGAYPYPQFIENPYTGLTPVPEVNTKAPKITAQPAERTNQDVTVTVEKDPEDLGIIEKFQYAFGDEEEWEDYTGPFSVPNNNTIRARTVYAGGAVSDASACVIDYIDKDGPRFRIISVESADNGINDDNLSNVTIEWSLASVPDCAYYRLFVGEDTDFTSDQPLAGYDQIANNIHTATIPWRSGAAIYVYMEAYDDLGNKGTAYIKDSFFVIPDGAPEWCCEDEHPGEQRFDMRFEGDGTKEEPFQIKTAEQLNHVRRHLDAYYIQMNDIVIDEDLNGELPGNFEPIGTKDDLTADNPNYVMKAFIGSYDGNGKTISGLQIESETKYSGLFGYLGREYYPKGEVKNIILDNGYVKGASDTATYLHQYVGGVVGEMIKAKVTNCVNKLDVSSVSREGSVGGVVGYVRSSNVTYCLNEGNVNFTEGEVPLNVSGYTGGVVGTNMGSNIIGCKNTGSVVGNVWLGGIIGYNGFGGYFRIADCTNQGTIYIKGEYAGGIVGGGHVFFYTYASRISNCHNQGRMIYIGAYEMPQAIGGIVGNCANTIIENCSNSADIQVPGGGGVGGIAGSFSRSSDYKSTIRNSYNTGNISGNSRIGGIAGEYEAYDCTPMTNCYNKGVVTGHQGVGGIAGINNQRTSIEYCYNRGFVNGIVTGSASEQGAGGIVGINGGFIAKCYNTGLVRGTSDNIGGIVGQNLGTLVYQRPAIVEDCFNVGTVWCEDADGGDWEDSVGGIVGNNGGEWPRESSCGIVRNTYNIGRVFLEIDTEDDRWLYGPIVGAHVNGDIDNNHFRSLIGNGMGTKQEDAFMRAAAGEIAGSLVDLLNEGARMEGKAADWVIDDSEGYPYPQFGNMKIAVDAALILPVQDVVFSHLRKYVAAGTVLTLSCPTEGADIYYTTNGQDPLVGGLLYQGEEFTILADTTIKAFAQKAGYMNSNVSPMEYVVVETDEEKLAAAFEALRIVYGEGDHGQNVTQNLGLPLLGEYGSVISWQSDYEGVVSAGGIVNRPDAVTGSKAVKLTATINMDGLTETKVFDLTVKAMPPVGCIEDLVDPVNEENFAEGAGTALSPYVIRTIKQLNHVRRHLDAHFLLGNDLTFSAGDDLNGAALGNFNSIGIYNVSDPAVSFRGVFDGGNHTIYGLNISSTAMCTGLFAMINDQNSVIKDLCVAGGSVQSTNNYTGGVVGYAMFGRVEGCTNKNQVTGKNYTGGIVGQITHASFTKCYNEGEITGTANYTGGIAGYINTTTEVSMENSYNKGQITGVSYIGGIVGYNNSANYSIRFCYNTGKIRSTSNYDNYYAGGIAGSSRSWIDNCYNTGEISRNDEYSDGIAGGIIGYNNGTVSACYNVGANKSFGMKVGSIAGSNPAGKTVTDCYYLSGTGVVGIGDNQGVGTNVSGKTEAELKMESTYQGFDFQSIWVLLPQGGYPLLRDTLDLDPSQFIVELTGISLNPTERTIMVGERLQLDPIIDPYNASNQNIIWTTDREDIATVSANGLVTGVSGGEAVITVTTEEGAFSATCRISVQEVPKGIISGNVYLQGKNDFSGIRVSIPGFDPVYTCTLGSFQMEVSQGYYTMVEASKEKFLPAIWRSTVQVQSGGTVTLPNVTLLCGDIFDSGSPIINIQDLVELAMNYGTTDETCDLNQDGLVDLFDLVLLSKNYGKTETPW